MCKVGANVHESCCLHLFGVGCRPEARSSRVVSANFGFRQKVFISAKVGVTTIPHGGKISEMTSQIMFGYVLTRVLLCKCVENMV